MFGQVPAVLTVDIGEQSAHVRCGSAARFDPADPAGDPAISSLKMTIQPSGSTLWLAVTARSLVVFANSE
ncbi:hypothetical protein [Nonomuraea turcica]|uniref:hypothetical protein n=1 Tax=Nonomuraea sp. G32 TaxID=3067274 RepID=UPI00353003D7